MALSSPLPQRKEERNAEGEEEEEEVKIFSVGQSAGLKESAMWARRPRFGSSRS